MPQVTVGAAAETSIPARRSSVAADNQTRTNLIVAATTGTILFSWKEGDAATGVPLPASGIGFSGPECSQPLYLYSTAGGVASFTEFPPR